MLSLSSPNNLQHHSHPMSQPTCAHEPVPADNHLDIDNLIHLVDEHLAWQQEPAHPPSRRSSVGTLIVDWDGTGEMRVHRRERIQAPTFTDTNGPWSRHDSVLSHTTHTGYYDTTAGDDDGDDNDDGLSYTYHAPRPRSSDTSPRSACSRSPRVTGYDPATNFTYDYNGRVIHVHRDRGAGSLRPESGVSEYFAVDAESYEAGVRVRVVDAADKTVRVKSGPKVKVVGFVEKVLGRLEAWGVLGRLRGDLKKRKGRRGVVKSWGRGGFAA